jgi:hypothetical protein
MSSILTSEIESFFAIERKYRNEGSAEVIQNSFSDIRNITPSCSTKPSLSHQQVYWASPGWHCAISRTITDCKKLKDLDPVILYLNRGEVSSSETELRIA